MTDDVRKLVSVEQKSAIRECLDRSWLAFEKGLAEYLQDPELSNELVFTLRSLRTAERALVDDEVTPMTDAEFHARVTEEDPAPGGGLLEPASKAPESYSPTDHLFKPKGFS